MQQGHKFQIGITVAKWITELVEIVIKYIRNSNSKMNKNINSNSRINK